MRASSKKQFEMFGRYSRRADLESRSFYSAVLYLRSKGESVLRVSQRQSKGGNRLLSNKELMAMAFALGWGR